MNSPRCSRCGAETVSRGKAALCFSCQIEDTSNSSRSDDTFFVDAEPSKERPDVDLRERISASIPGIELGETIGRGGMGVVYAGVQTSLDRKVAVKVLPPIEDDPEQEERFDREARAMAKLQHPRIVAIHDYGRTEDGVAWFAMEFAGGGSLKTRMTESGIAPREACEIAVAVCEGLEYAHGEGIVHRDVKPANVLIDERGRVKLADFGIAKLEGARHTARLTRTHQVLGTPLYMAPEQLHGAAEVDARADVYAVGIMLYEMLTKTLPDARPMAPSQVPEVDPRLDKLIFKAIENDPRQRFAGARELGDALRDILATWRNVRRKESLIRRLLRRPER